MLRIAPLLLTIGLAVAAEPALRVTVPDLPGTRARLEQSGYGAAWSDAAVAGWYASLQPTDPAASWGDAVLQAREFRGELSIGPRHGGLPVILADAALLTPSAAPPGPSPFTCQRAEGWLLARLGADTPSKPGPAIPGGQGKADAGLWTDVQAWTTLLPSSAGKAAGGLCERLHVGAVTATCSVGRSGLSDRVSVPEAHLPLRILDQSALVGIPARPIALLVVGLDGGSLASVLQDLLDPATEAVIEAWSGVKLADLAAACDGTLVASVSRGPRGLEWFLSLPRHPAIDTLVGTRIAEQAPDGAEEILAAIDEQPVLVAWPGLGRWLVRRAATRWYFGTSPVELGAAASGAEAGFALARLCPEAGDATMIAAYADLTAVVPLLASLLPEDRTGLRPALAAAAAHLPPLSLAATQDEAGLTVNGRNSLGLALPILAALPAAGPALAEAYVRSATAEASQRIALLLARSKAFAAATSGHWPRDLTDLRGWARELNDDKFAMAGRPDLKAPFCYVAPHINSPPDQPVIVQDPACNRGSGSLVGFVSGEVRFMPGVLYWREANRLGITSEARSEGVPPEAWATMPKTF